jgi:DNA-binding GntR family transcriptional regulator
VTDRAPTTLSEQVYVALRADLLRGLLQPGSKLKLSDFSARFSVSLSVVREAMARLAEQGPRAVQSAARILGDSPFCAI